MKKKKGRKKNDMLNITYSVVHMKINDVISILDYDSFKAQTEKRDL
jgi:hypothetical protein